MNPRARAGRRRPRAGESGSLDWRGARSSPRAHVRVTFDDGGSSPASCRSVAARRGIEDAHPCPPLHAADAAPLDPVLDGLDLEHHVIHDVLEHFDRVLVTMAHGDTSPGSAAGAEAACPTCAPTSGALRDLLLSRRFRYKEGRSVRRSASTSVMV